MNFLLEFCMIGLFTSSSIVSGTCVFDKEPIPVVAVRTNSGIQKISSKDPEFFDFVYDIVRSEDCELVATYGGEVTVGNRRHPLLGTEYVCRKQKMFVRIESGGPHLLTEVKRLR